MPLRVKFPKLRSIFPPVTTAMSSATAPSDIGVSEDAQYWHRHISLKAPPHWVYSKPIQKSQQDDREYRLIRLDNGLQVMLVHDAKADKAAASLDVAVGHLHDPVGTHFPHRPSYVC
jgi:insulysin